MYVFCNSQLAEPGYVQHIAFPVNNWSTQSASAGIRYSKSEDSHVCGPKRIPGEDEEAQKAPDKNADKDVSVVIHSQKHDHIRNRKLQSEDASTNGLLKNGWEQLTRYSQL